MLWFTKVLGLCSLVMSEVGLSELEDALESLRLIICRMSPASLIDLIDSQLLSRVCPGASINMIFMVKLLKICMHKVIGNFHDYSLYLVDSWEIKSVYILIDVTSFLIEWKCFAYILSLIHI